MIFFHNLKNIEKSKFSKFHKKNSKFRFGGADIRKTINVSNFVLMTSFRFSSSRQIEWPKGEDSTTNIKKVMEKSVDKNRLSLSTRASASKPKRISIII